MRINKFKVTKKAMRPASPERQCFYCQQPIWSDHKDDCVLINKKVKVRMIVEYEVEVPASWGKEDIEFHRNEGTWCTDNALIELDELDNEKGCLCGITKFEYIGEESDPFLDE